MTFPCNIQISHYISMCLRKYIRAGDVSIGIRKY